MARAPRMMLILSENWTMTDGRSLADLVRWAQIAEDAGFDAVMLSEHVVLGRDASDQGVMDNPRAYALPGNQDPLMPWPSSLVLLSAIAAATTRVRLVASAVLAPLRHPLALARDWGTLDLVSGGRLVMQPSVSWSKDEYDALGVPFAERGRILDEQLEVLDLVWRASPASYAGTYFSFDDVWLEPKGHRHGGPRLWFGGQRAHGKIVERLVRYGSGFHPLGAPSDDDLTRISGAMGGAGRDLADLELVGGVRVDLPDDGSPADIGRAIDSIAPQWERGFSTFGLKPSMFVDDQAELPSFCRDVIRRADAVAA